jgi:LPS-assembly protein
LAKASGAVARWHARVAAAAMAAALALLAGVAFALLAGTAHADAPAGARGAALFQAESITHDLRADVITAEGNVEIRYGGRMLRADRLVYERARGQITAQGNVSLREKTGEVFFADHIELSDDLRDGAAESLSVLLAENVRLAAAGGAREGGTVTRLDKAVFSPCRVCRDSPTPLWQIRAARVVHDSEAGTVTYEDAAFEVMGVAIAHTPYFRHADPSVERQSGFLAPTFGSRSELGYFAEIPYYMVLKPNMDLTVAPMVTTQEGVVLKSEFRHRTVSGRYRLDGSITYPERRDDQGGRIGGHRLRGHIFGEGLFDINEKWRWGFDIQGATDDTYLRRYGISDLDRLVNRAYAEGFTGRDYTSLSTIYFQGLRAEDNKRHIPYVPALAEHNAILDTKILGGTAGFDLNALTLRRLEGQDVYRLSASVSWKRPVTTANGQVITPFTEGRFDVYQVIGMPHSLGGTQDKLFVRGLPTIGVDWRWPLVRHSPVLGLETSQILEPIVQVIASSYGGNPAGLPNEDSIGFEFDDTNLFSINKFPGLDRWESGVRANVGLRYTIFDFNGRSAGFLFGQTFRLREDTAFPVGTGLRDTRSDYVGRIHVVFSPYIDLTHRFRLGRDDFSARRNEITMRAGTADYNLQVGYVRLAGPEPLLPFDSREEVFAQGYIRLAENWGLTFAGRRDLEENVMISSSTGLRYMDECTDIELSFNRRFTRDRDIRPSTALVLRIRLFTLG